MFKYLKKLIYTLVVFTTISFSAFAAGNTGRLITADLFVTGEIIPASCMPIFSQGQDARLMVGVDQSQQVVDGFSSTQPLDLTVHCDAPIVLLQRQNELIVAAYTWIKPNLTMPVLLDTPRGEMDIQTLNVGQSLDLVQILKEEGLVTFELIYL